jgi:ribosome-associated protein
MSPGREADQEPDEFNSKDQAAAADELQRLGERLVRLSDRDLASVPLAEDLRDAVLEAQRLKPRTEQLRRQLQFVGRLMRKADPGPIIARLQMLDSGGEAALLQRQAEGWRVRLLAEGDAGLQALVELRPGLDRLRWRQLVRKVSRLAPGTAEREKGERELDTELRKVLQET